MIEVATPDGGVAEFPDGTHPDVIRNAMRAKFGGGPAKDAAKEIGTSGGVGGFLKSVGKGFVGGLMNTALESGRAAYIEMGQDPESIPAPVRTGGQPTNKLEKYGETIGGFWGNPASWIGPGGFAIKATTAVTSAVGSEALGQATEGTKQEPYARIIGAVLGALALGKAVRGVTPLPTDPRRMQAVQNLRAEGVEPTAGQVTGNRALKFAESALGDAPAAGGAATAAKERIGEQLTQAALARIRETAERTTPDVLHRALNRIGGQFDALAARNDARLDRVYLTDILQAEQEYNHLFVDPLRKPLVENVVEHAFNQLQRSQTMTGPQYQALRSRIERMRRSARSDPELSMFLADVRDSMDGLMERNIARNNPADAGAWREARNQYRNFLVVETAATGAGEEAAKGIISPARLRQATIAKQGRREYASGRGDFAELARSAEEIIQYPPSSGTSERGLTLGALAGHASLLFAPGLAGRGLNSRPVQSYLKNQWAAPLIRRMPRWQVQALRAAIVEQTTGSR